MFNFSRTMFPLWVWFVGFLIIFLSAVVLWFIWTYLEIGRNYFGFLPEPLQAPSFWAVLGILICLSIVGGIAFG